MSPSVAAAWRLLSHLLLGGIYLGHEALAHLTLSRSLEEEARVSRSAATKALRGLVGKGLLEWHGTSATDGLQYYSLPQ